jgi:hypothetical protein
MTSERKRVFKKRFYT